MGLAAAALKNHPSNPAAMELIGTGSYRKNPVAWAAQDHVIDTLNNSRGDFGEPVHFDR